MNRIETLAVVLVVAGVLGHVRLAEAQAPPAAPPVASATTSTPVTTATVADAPAQQPVPPPAPRARKSYFVPAAEIIGFDTLLNRFNYYVSDKVVYGTSLTSIRRNATGKWIADTDPFAMNQFYHPYQGSLYFGFARSAGLNYWTALVYTLSGSALWEIAGETGRPSYNDQMTTGIGGTFFGESLFRVASLILEKGEGNVGFWRGLAATLISPATGFNRQVFRHRFDSVFPRRDPALFARLRLGASLSEEVTQEGVSQTHKRKEVLADFHLSYGFPGKPGYTYTRPFDYFDLQFTAVNSNVFENVMSRGMLVGTDYAAGDTYRGIWGLYGTYEYISPQIFRVSSTALSLGSTGAWRMSRSMQLQGTLMGGVGYGAAGISHSSSTERDYHYGVTPQGLLALRLLFGGKANLDMTARGYYVSGVGSTESRGSERIVRGETALTFRIYGHNTITLRYVASRRDAYYPELPDRHQTIGTFSLLYGRVSSGHNFGAVHWLPKDMQIR